MQSTPLHVTPNLVDHKSLTSITSYSFNASGLLCSSSKTSTCTEISMLLKPKLEVRSMTVLCTRKEAKTQLNSKPVAVPKL